jgi:DNA-binding NtrC family response regulator
VIQGETGVLAGKSVLIVDDDPGVRALYDKILTKAGCAVGLAEDGNAALAAMETTHADLVLVDMLMPDKDGVGTIMAVQDRWPQCIIVAMSGGGWIDMDDCLRLAQLAGADGMIRKPLPIKALVETLSQIMQNAKLRPATPLPAPG